MKTIVNIFIAISLLLPFALSAANETYSNRIVGTAITNTGTSPHLSVFDGRFGEMYSNPNWSSLYTNYQVKNKLQLGINPNVLQNNDLAGGVTVSIKTWVWNATTSSFTTSTTSNINLTVNYFVSTTAIIDELSSYTFSGASKFEVTITGVNGGANFDVNDVFLEGTIEVERYYSFSGLAPTSVGAVASSNFVDFEWSQVGGAERYELEYVHINDYKLINSVL